MKLRFFFDTSWHLTVTLFSSIPPLITNGCGFLWALLYCFQLCHLRKIWNSMFFILKFFYQVELTSYLRFWNLYSVLSEDIKILATLIKFISKGIMWNYVSFIEKIKPKVFLKIYDFNFWTTWINFSQFRALTLES